MSSAPLRRKPKKTQQPETRFLDEAGFLARGISLSYLYHVRSINHNIPVGAGFLDGQLLAGIVCEPAPTKIGVALPDMILGIKRLKTRFLPRCLVAAPNILR